MRKKPQEASQIPETDGLYKILNKTRTAVFEGSFLHKIDQGDLFICRLASVQENERLGNKYEEEIKVCIKKYCSTQCGI